MLSVQRVAPLLLRQQMESTKFWSEANKESKMEEYEEALGALTRYDHKVEELNTMALISTLLFGFSVAVWMSFDERLFLEEPVHAILFTVSVMATIIGSALSTVISVAFVIALRRITFKYGKSTNLESLHEFKRGTNRVRHWVRKGIIVSFLGAFVSLAVYSAVKWKHAQKKVILVSLTSMAVLFGVLLLYYSYVQIKRAYNKALLVGGGQV